MKQQTFASLSYAHKKKQTRKEKFLLEMERFIPMSASLRLKNAKVVKKYQKRGHYPDKAGQSVSKTMNLSIKRQIH